MKIKCSIVPNHQPYANLMIWNLKIMNINNIIADTPTVFFSRDAALKFRDKLMLKQSKSNLINQWTNGGNIIYSVYQNKTFKNLKDLILLKNDLVLNYAK
jgi:hypothetical protein